MVNKRRQDPLAGPAGALVKFVISAAVGGLVALAVLSAGFDAFRGSRWVHVLWFIPLVWGVLGIFWHLRVLDATRAVFEEFFEVER